jgi:hypothetical protein
MNKPLFGNSSREAGYVNDEVRRSGVHEAPSVDIQGDQELESLPELMDQAAEDAAHAEKVRMILQKTDEIAARRLTPKTAIPSRIDVPEGNPDDTKTGRKPLI